jgi:hypothetical protein
MLRTTTTALRPQSPDVAPQALNAQLDQLRAEAAQLEIRAHDLGVQRDQIRMQQDQSPPTERARLNKQVADAEHSVAATMAELNGTRIKVRELEQARDFQRTFTLQPPPDPFLDREQIMQVLGGGAVLLFPLVLALARRLWVRGRPAAAPADLESSPRLQRMEQAIESIAIEVERIGEAQRFATKLMTERADAVNRIGAAPMTPARREPGTITPH